MFVEYSQFGWSKETSSLGQFTGSTGAQILTPRELASGTQAWAKKVFITPQETHLCLADNNAHFGIFTHLGQSYTRLARVITLGVFDFVPWLSLFRVDFWIGFYILLKKELRLFFTKTRYSIVIFFKSNCFHRHNMKTYKTYLWKPKSLPKHFNRVITKEQLSLPIPKVKF